MKCRGFFGEGVWGVESRDEGREIRWKGKGGEVTERKKSWGCMVEILSWWLDLVVLAVRVLFCSLHHGARIVLSTMPC